MVNLSALLPVYFNNEAFKFSINLFLLVGVNFGSEVRSSNPKGNFKTFQGWLFKFCYEETI